MDIVENPAPPLPQPILYGNTQNSVLEASSIHVGRTKMQESDAVGLPKMDGVPRHVPEVTLC